MKVVSDKRKLLSFQRPNLGVLKEKSNEEQTGAWSEIKIDPISEDWRVGSKDLLAKI